MKMCRWEILIYQFIDVIMYIFISATKTTEDQFI